MGFWLVPVTVTFNDLELHTDHCTISAVAELLVIKLLMSFDCYCLRYWAEILRQTGLSVSQWEDSFSHLLALICLWSLVLAALTSLLAMVYVAMKLNTLQKVYSQPFRYAAVFFKNMNYFCYGISWHFNRSRLRSADENQLLVPRTQTVTLGPRAFSTSGPDTWNTLSSELRHSSVSLDCFKRSLKTFLYRL